MKALVFQHIHTADAQNYQLERRTVKGVSKTYHCGCRRSAKMSALTGQHKYHIHGMENMTLTQKEQARLQVLNSLLAEHMTLDQAATLMGVTTRHTRRILAAYREEGPPPWLTATGAARHPTQRLMPWWPMWFVWLAPSTKEPTTPISASC